MELYQAIVKMEQDGSADGVLQVCLNKCGPTRVFWELSWVHLQLQFQVRADRIQTDLDELVKAVNERCKKYGLRAKPITLTELPFGKFLSCFPMFFYSFYPIRQSPVNFHIFSFVMWHSHDILSGVSLSFFGDEKYLLTSTHGKLLLEARFILSNGSGQMLWTL